MGEDLEVCCICLDSLSSQPITVLLTSSVEPRRSCQHYLHARCAEHLASSRCPLCRSGFAALAADVDGQTVGNIGAGGVICSLARLEGCPTNSCYTEAVVGLLAATLPVPTTEVRVALNRAAGSDAASIDEQTLAQVLPELGVMTPDPLEEASEVWVRVQSRYSFATVAARRLRWATLKAAGAAGTSVLFGGCGMGLGVMSGAVAAVPGRRWRGLVDHLELDDIPEDGLFSPVSLLKLAAVVCVCLYHGAQRRDIVFKGCKWGMLCGALLGWTSALWLVDPDRPGDARSAFLAGLTGEAFGDRRPRMLRNSAARRVQVLKAKQSM